LPFRVFGAAARPLPSPTWVVLFWNRPPVQSIRPAVVSPLLLLRSRCAVGALPRLCGLPAADCCRRLFRLPAASSRRVSPSSRVLPSVTYPTAAAIRSSHGLWFPTALKESEVHLSRARSLPATFRLQGLATLLTAYSLESRAGFVSHRRRSWDSPFGGFPSQKIATVFSTGTNPRTVSSALLLPPKRQTGLTSPSFWVHVFRECLATTRVFKPATAGASHGFCPSRVCLRKP